MSDFTLHVDGWAHGEAIPPRYAFGTLDENDSFALSDNRSPAVRWTNPPEGTRSFALVLHDPDVPSVGDDVNQEGRTVPADLPRVDFYHWLVADIPADTRALDEGAASDGVTAGGKPVGEVEYGRTGSNNYTQWFAGDPAMEGTYGGYDGPCPPWNDSIVHHYVFTLYALDVERCPVDGVFGGGHVRDAIAPHILAQASVTGTYSLNPDIKA